jgi:predicted esterase
MLMNFSKNNPHQGQPILQSGLQIEKAKAAMLMVHGRGASAEDILTLADELEHPDFVYLAPQAYGNTWYPYPFMTPVQQNEPWLSSALGVIAALLEHLTQHGLPLEKVILLGFSQGACLSLEYAARHTRRYGGLVGLSGGLIGSPGTRWDYPALLDGTTVFMGCSDPDPHISRERVIESEQVLTRLGGSVTTRLYPNLGHTVNQDELEFVREMMEYMAG